MSWQQRLRSCPEDLTYKQIVDYVQEEYPDVPFGDIYEAEQEFRLRDEGAILSTYFREYKKETFYRDYRAGVDKYILLDKEGNFLPSYKLELGYVRIGLSKTKTKKTAIYPGVATIYAHYSESETRIHNRKAEETQVYLEQVLKLDVETMTIKIYKKQYTPYLA